MESKGVKKLKRSVPMGLKRYTRGHRKKILKIITSRRDTQKKSIEIRGKKLHAEAVHAINIQKFKPSWIIEDTVEPHLARDQLARTAVSASRHLPKKN